MHACINKIEQFFKIDGWIDTYSNPNYDPRVNQYTAPARCKKNQPMNYGTGIYRHVDPLDRLRI